MEKNIKISIVIVTFKRPKLLARCLDSIAAATGKPPHEILVVINGSDSKSSELVSKHSTQLIQLKARVTPGEARNRAAAKATGEYILFLDDDVYLPPHYFEKASEYYSSSKVDVFGGPDQTATDACFFERAIGTALTSPMATASTRYRHQKATLELAGNEQNLILCALWIKKELFHKVEFDPRFFRNEENVLLSQLQNPVIEYDSELWVEHKRKTDVLQLSRAIGGSGYYRMKMFYHFKAPHPLYFVPLLFVCYLAILPFATSETFIFPLALYLLLNGITSLTLGRRELALIPFIMGYQFLINVSYGIGSLVFFAVLLRDSIGITFLSDSDQQRD